MNKLVSFKGVLAPIPTPFSFSDESVYKVGIVNLISFLHKNGVDGVFALGSYGSFPLMSESERRLAAEIIVKECKDRNMFVVLHIGHASLATAKDLLDHARSLDVDAVASVSPYYYSGHAYRWSDILSYHKSLIEHAGNTPYCIYNNPRTTGFSLTANQLLLLAQAGASGLKDSGNDSLRFKEYIDMTSSLEFNCMPGSGSTMLECFRLGAKAIVAGTAVVYPEEVMHLYSLIENGSEKAMQDTCQADVIRCRDRQMKNIMRPAAAYVLLREKGIDIGYPRAPWPKNED